MDLSSGLQAFNNYYYMKHFSLLLMQYTVIVSSSYHVAYAGDFAQISQRPKDLVITDVMHR